MVMDDEKKQVEYYEGRMEEKFGFMNQKETAKIFIGVCHTIEEYELLKNKLKGYPVILSVEKKDLIKVMKWYGCKVDEMNLISCISTMMMVEISEKVKEYEKQCKV